MSKLGKARIRVPDRAAKGQVVEIRTMVEHPMDSGYRVDNMGRTIRRHIVESFTCTYGGKEVFRARLFPAISTNPYFVFHLVASESAELRFTWQDDQAGAVTETAFLTVA